MALTYEEARDFLGEDDELIDGVVVEIVPPSIENIDDNS